MNGLRDAGRDLIIDLAQRASAGELPCDIVVCPPALLLAQTAAGLSATPIYLGCQDCHVEASGAHTGDVSAEMLADSGCRYVIVGHSERRADHGEDDALVSAKAAAAHRAGLVAIVCLGESESERAAGQELAVVERQLAGSLPPGARAANTVVAYEPVWAIGSGRTPSESEVEAVHLHLRARLAARMGREGAAVRILYGGSVKAENAAGLMAIKDVDGALVGGASLSAASFWPIVEALVAAKAGT
jgi:triosephosphate isomerase